MNLFISQVTTKWSKYETWQHRSAKVIRSKIIFYRIWKLIYGLLVSIFRGYMYFVFFWHNQAYQENVKKISHWNSGRIQLRFETINRAHTEITTGWLVVNGTTTKCCGFWATSQMSQSTKSDGARMRVKRLQSALCFCSRNILKDQTSANSDAWYALRMQIADGWLLEFQEAFLSNTSVFYVLGQRSHSVQAEIYFFFWKVCLLLLFQSFSRWDFFANANANANEGNMVFLLPFTGLKIDFHFHPVSNCFHFHFQVAQSLTHSAESWAGLKGFRRLVASSHSSAACSSLQTCLRKHFYHATTLHWTSKHLV